MQQAIQAAKNLLTLEWTYSAICILCILLFPEYFAPFFSILSIFFAYKDAKKRNYAFKIGISGKLIWIYVLTMFFSLFYSQTRLSSLATIGMWIVMFPAYLSLFTILNSKRRMFQFMMMISICFGIIGFISVIEYIGCTTLHFSNYTLQFWNFLDEQVYKLYPGELHLFSKGIRTASTFSNPNIFAEAMIFITPFVICSYHKSKQSYLKIISFVCLFLGVLGLTFSFSRASYICIFGIIIAFFIFNPFNYSNKKYFAILAITICVILMLIFIPNIYAERMSTLQPEEHSVSERMNIWSVTYEYIIEHPILGVGAGVQGTTNLFTSAGLPPTVPHAHNLFLQILLELGILGLCVFLVPTIRTLFVNIRICHKSNAYRCYSFASMLSIALIFCFGMVEYPLLCPKLVGLFYVILALCDTTEKFSPDLNDYILRK